MPTRLLHPVSLPPRRLTARARGPHRLTSLLLGALLLSGCAASAKTGAHATHAKAATKRATVTAEADAQTYAGRPELATFTDELLARHRDLDRAWVGAMLDDARLMPSVRRYIMPPASPRQKNWGVYRSRFVEPTRIRAGLAFWQQNERWLQAAETKWRVPASVIVGIIGVETIYGRQTGGFRVLDALATLAFDFPPGRSDRSAFFRDELGDFLAWAWRQHADARVPLGSYAGAMGLPQFMPSSVLKHAVDFDGDGRIDLHDSPADVIGSVANYLANFGWQPGQPTRFSVTPPEDTAQRAALLAPDIQPTFSASDMAARGAMLSPAGQRYDGRLSLIELRNGDGEPDWIAGTQNFWVVTRYNWSAFYALAVLELGEAVERARQRPTASFGNPAPSPLAPGLTLNTGAGQPQVP